MARRNWRSAWKAPKPPKGVKQKRPLVSELRSIYKDLVSLDAGQRLNCLAQAMAWYDNALPYLLGKTGALTTEQAKDWDTAAKCRDRGISTTFNGEKESAFKQALIRYQKVCDAVLSPPDVRLFYAELDQDESRIKERQERMEQKYGQLLDLLNKSLKPVNVDGKPVEIKIGNIQNNYQMDPERSSFTLQRAMVKELRTVARLEGLLVVVFELLKPLSKLCSLKPEQDAAGIKTGRYVTTASEQMQAYDKLLSNFIEYCKIPDATPKRLVKPQLGPGAVTAKAPRAASSTPRTPGAPARGPLRGGIFVDGTAVSWIFTQLVSGETKSIKELQKNVNADIIGRLQRIDSVGRQQALRDSVNTFRVKIDAKSDSARMVFPTPEAHKHWMEKWNQTVAS